MKEKMLERKGRNTKESIYFFKLMDIEFFVD